jgi:hypothetical protein
MCRLSLISFSGRVLRQPRLRTLVLFTVTCDSATSPITLINHAPAHQGERVTIGERPAAPGGSAEAILCLHPHPCGSAELDCAVFSQTSWSSP